MKTRRSKAHPKSVSSKSLKRKAFGSSSVPQSSAQNIDVDSIQPSKQLRVANVSTTPLIEKARNVCKAMEDLDVEEELKLELLKWKVLNKINCQVAVVDNVIESNLANIKRQTKKITFAGTFKEQIVSIDLSVFGPYVSFDSGIGMETQHYKLQIRRFWMVGLETALKVVDW
ncbi:hypothetical protein VNO78_06551 [Psophocarpus tetragonolobus]|uniref:Uncharacterized protein n=1 Tax=Psophocarpus tetragonolobus TaxID=3891 RepID=A0AAN9XRH3_PSOTE